MICGISRFLKRESLLSLEILLLLPLVLGLFVTGIGFFFGKVCSPWTLRVLYVVELVVVSMVSWRQGLKLLGSLIALACLTALTFSFTGCDAMAYHFPMQDLLINGWNPVFDSSLEKFDRVVGDLSLSRYHTLFLPKVNALCGALVALSLGVYTGDSFLNYVLMICLFSVAYRFAKQQWNIGGFMCGVFAVVCTVSTKMTAFLAGHVDYVLYASFAISIFTACLWVCNASVRDLCMLCATLTICMLAKTTGLMCGMLIMFIVMICAWRRQSFWMMFLTLALLILAIGASPLLTAWIQYGSPVYPTMTFDPSVQPIDITSDFSGNEDSARMGYLARISYAWFSAPLTVKLCSLLYGQPNFNPIFEVPGGVGGLGSWFNILLILSFISLVFSKKNIVTVIVIFVFITGNLAPLKYIGFNRYFPQMWLIPALSFFNLYACSSVRLRKLVGIVVSYFSRVLISVLLILSTISLLRIAAYQCRSAVVEDLRRSMLSDALKKGNRYRVSKNSINLEYSFVKRANQAGVEIVSDGTAPELLVDRTLLIMSAEPVDDKINDILSRFPICNSPSELIKFPWREAIGTLCRVGPLVR